MSRAWNRVKDQHNGTQTNPSKKLISIRDLTKYSSIAHIGCFNYSRNSNNTKCPVAGGGVLKESSQSMD